MKSIYKGAILLQACACLLFGSAAFAQDKPAERFTYATYMVCDVTKQERADEIFAEVQKPIYDAAVADGTIKSWGWMAHHTGGNWRRGMYYGSDSVQGLLDAQKKIGDLVDAKSAKLSEEFGKICNSHEDYIWRTVAGNIGSVTRGAASFSVYHVCDQGREEQADALMTQVFAPVFDKFLAEGKILSWGWNEHIVGGDFRRLSTISAKDTKSLMEARAALVTAIYDHPLGDTLTEICGPHVDYMWNITSQNP